MLQWLQEMALMVIYTLTNWLVYVADLFLVDVLHWTMVVSVNLALVALSALLLSGMWIAGGITVRYFASVPGDIWSEMKRNKYILF